GVGVRVGVGARAGNQPATEEGARAGTGTGAGAESSSGGDLADRPFSAGGPGAGGALGGGGMPRARSGGNEDVFPLPNLEPASDRVSRDSAASGTPGLNSAARPDGSQQQRGRPPFSGQPGDESPAIGGGQTDDKSLTSARPARAGSGVSNQGFDWAL